MKLPWQKTDIERTLKNEPDQFSTDRGTAHGLYEDLMKRDPKRAAKLLEQMEKDAQWQSTNS